MSYYVYILASRKHGTLYIGVTNDIARRIWQHRQGVGSRFARRYRVTRLVHVETHEEIARAIQREKTMKEWPRAWKVRLIERGNPEWEDLYDRLNGLGHWVPGTSPGTTAVAVERECALLGELHQRPCHHVSGAPTCPTAARSEEHTSELQSLMRISYAVFCLKKNKTLRKTAINQQINQQPHTIPTHYQST